MFAAECGHPDKAHPLGTSAQVGKHMNVYIRMQQLDPII